MLQDLPLHDINTKRNNQYVNKTTYWGGTDTEENFQEQSIIHLYDRDLKTYRENPIEYVHNNYGFRTPDNFEQGDAGTVFLGSSHTSGIGHYLENTWSYILSQELEGKFLNLSRTGLGIGGGFRILNYFKDILDIKRVIMFFPHQTRYDYFDPVSGNYRTISERREGFKELKKVLLHKNNYKLYYTMALYGIKSVCHEIGAELIYKESFDDIPLIPNPNSHLKVQAPRDMKHVSVHHQYSLYKYFQNLI